ncbi:MAG: aldo/keto reductase [Bacteroidales bacterium]|jgi:diketogulonate reductase-like aldo/keto reductase
MSLLSENYTLYNGVKIPKIGFGTWQISNAAVYDAVSFALKTGYRHIDTARAYGNEENVGRAVRDSKLKREEVFVTSKLPAEIKGFKEARASFEKTMRNLGFSYLDLFLIHAPWPWNDKGRDCTEGNIASWKVMEELYREGKVRAIGVSNFSVTDINAIIENCEIVPMVNQIAIYIGHLQDGLTEYCRQRNILVEAYSPLATGGILKIEAIREVAKQYGASPAQVCIRYLLQKDLLPLPKSTHPNRIAENAEVGFTIRETDMKSLDSIHQDLSHF